MEAGRWKFNIITFSHQLIFKFISCWKLKAGKIFHFQTLKLTHFKLINFQMLKLQLL